MSAGSPDDFAAAGCHLQLIGRVQKDFGLVGIFRGDPGDIFHPDGHGSGDQRGDNRDQVGHEIGDVVDQKRKPGFNCRASP